MPKKSHRVGPNETIEIYFRDQTRKEIRAQEIALDILFEDDYLLVVNKPAGMVTHPAHGHFEGTLVNALMFHLGERTFVADSNKDGKPDEGNFASIRPGIVHRLDKGTSGLLVVAKSESIHRKLTEQFSARTVEREYVSLVWGRFKETTGEISAPLARHPGDRKRFAVARRGGKEAITTFRILETFRDTTLLALKLRTGRTHQIRVHLEHRGHPVFGDSTYGGGPKRLTALSGAKRKFYEESMALFSEFALHARTLGFVHPVTKKTLFFTREVPSYFAKLLILLRQDAEKSLDIG